MIGTFGYNDGSTNSPFIAFKNTAGFTWVSNVDNFTDFGVQAWADLMASAARGEVWNKGRWPALGGTPDKLWRSPLPLVTDGNWLHLFSSPVGMKGVFDWSDPSGPIATIPA